MERREMHPSDMARAHTQTVRTQTLTTEGVDRREQFDAWREYMGAIFDVEPLGPTGNGFNGSTEMADLNSLQLVRFDLDPVTFHHSAGHVRQSGVDHWSLTVLRTGKLETAAAESHLRAPKGAVVVHSYAVPMSGQTGRSDIVSVYIERDEFSPLADALDRRFNHLLDGPMAELLREFILSLHARGRTLRRDDVPAVEHALKSLLQATLEQNARLLDTESAPIAAAQFNLARRFINENLKSRHLEPDAIAAALGLSRRQLYYLFESHGGVVRFIKNRRLAACYAALTRGEEKTLISSIAYEYGFTNVTSFYRQFKARYGVSPGEARSARLQGHHSPASTATTFAEWMVRAGGD